MKLVEEGLGGCFAKYLETAGEDEWRTFFSQVERIDFDHLREHRMRLFGKAPPPLTSEQLEPVAADPDQFESSARDRTIGLASLREGVWAVAVFAGGAGTRFFREWDNLDRAISPLPEAMRQQWPEREAPKGLFPISPVEGLNFCHLILAEVLEEGLACGKLPPLLFMTSSVTYSYMVRWLERDTLLGLPKEAVLLFQQREIPRLDAEGDLIVRTDGTLFWTGDGHGGVYAALSGTAESVRSIRDWLQSAGIRHLVMGNVDNAALSPLLPERLGYHLRNNARFTLTVVPRTGPSEPVGMPCRGKKDDRIRIIEYSELDPDLSAETGEDGGLRFNEGHVNTNLLDLDAVRTDLPGSLYTGKTVRVGDRKIQSSTYEFLNQHLASLLDPDDVRIYSGGRDDLFIPTKAIVGPDSVQSTFHTLNRLQADKLRRTGADVAGSPEEPLAFVDLHPCLGLKTEDLERRGVGPGWVLEKGARLFLCVRHGLTTFSRPFGDGLRLEEDATFILRTRKPYGTIEYDMENREIRESAENAPRISVGANVVVKKGVRVVLDLQEEAVLYIPDNAVFEKNVETWVFKGRPLRLEGSRKGD